MATRLGMGRSAVKFERLSGCGHPGGWRRSDVAVAGGRSGGGCSGDESRFGRSLNRRIGHPLSGRVEPLDLIRSGWKLGWTLPAPIDHRLRLRLLLLRIDIVKSGHLVSGLLLLLLLLWWGVIESGGRGGGAGRRTPMLIHPTRAAAAARWPRINIGRRTGASRQTTRRASARYPSAGGIPDGTWNYETERSDVSNARTNQKKKNQKENSKRATKGKRAKQMFRFFFCLFLKECFNSISPSDAFTRKKMKNIQYIYKKKEIGVGGLSNVGHWLTSLERMEH